MEVGLNEHTVRQRHSKRMLWYYERIIDCMVANPQFKIKDIAAEIGRSPSTVSMIINSDMFKAAYEQRRLQFTGFHDLALSHKMVAVAHQSLDLILERLEKKRDQVPLPLLTDLANKSLERLGYGVKSPPPGSAAVQVNVNQVALPGTVKAEDIEAARAAIRATQQQRLANSNVPLLEVQSQEAEPVKVEEEVVDAS